MRPVEILEAYAIWYLVHETTDGSSDSFANFMILERHTT